MSTVKAERLQQQQQQQLPFLKLPQMPLLVVFLLLAAVISLLSPVLGDEVYQPPQPFTVKTFTGANESWFTYPELTNPSTSNYSIPALLAKPNVGIAISGGGFRAATLGLGWLRALHLLNITSAARYFSSNSGGTWLNSAFSFQAKYPVEQFLGSYLPPEQLTLEVLRATGDDGASFAATITDASVVVSGASGRLLTAASPTCSSYCANRYTVTYGSALPLSA